MTAFKHSLTRADERSIRVEREFDAPLDLVWRAYSEPELLRRWWGRGHDVAVERFEFVRGGRWRFVERWDGGSAAFEGRFREVQPKTLISQTFEYDGAPGHPSIETIEFVDLGGGRTKVVITALFLEKADLDAMIEHGMEEGMAQSWEALDGVLAEVQAGVSR